MNDPAIRLRGVSKSYRVRVRSTPRLGAWVVDKLFEHLRSEPFEALSGVSLDFAKGELVGIVGDNGAGKSTLLKLIARIVEPTSGTVEVRGRIASLLELGVGFHPELSGMENIFYNGALMGLRRTEILERLDAIIDFSGMRDVIYDKVRTYSTGMYSRLACSVALHLDPDIILVDEILAVGDAEFQQKGMLRLLDLHERGATMLLVTHELTTARYLCDRLVWIEGGRVRADGPSALVYEVYTRSIALKSRHPSSPFHPAAAATPPRLRCGRITVEVDGAESDRIRRGATVVFRMDCDPLPQGTRAAIRIAHGDGRSLLESESGVLPTGSQRVEYAIPAWDFGGFAGEVEIALTDAGRDRIGGSAPLPLTSLAPGITQPGFLLLPTGSVTVRDLSAE